MISILLWLLFGAFVGWVASIIMNRNSSMGAFTNIAVGVVGAAIGGFLFRRDVNPSLFSLGSLLTALLGAIVLLTVTNLVTRGRVR